MVFRSDDNAAINSIGEDAKLKQMAMSVGDKQSNLYQHRKRTIADHVAVESPSETWLVIRVVSELLRYIGLGCQCITKLVALYCYGMLILPGLIQVGYNYYSSSRIRRSIVYGDQPRNRLDLYLPRNYDGSLKPVVALVTGGAWIIGYKAWGTLLGQHLSDRDIIVACIDYRNFPQGTISDMMRDASEGISFVFNNISKYGGDPNRIYLMGQSAGAHIAACTLLDQAIKETCEKESTNWSVSQIKAYLGLSGAYNMLNLVDHFHNRGLHRSIFLRCELAGKYFRQLTLSPPFDWLTEFGLISIMEGERSLQKFSPELIVQDGDFRNAAALLPPNVLFHGTGDYSIPSDSSKNFADSLQRIGVEAESIMYEGKTHTDLFLQDPMRGGKDDMFEYIVAYIHGDDSESPATNMVSRRRLVPEFMLKLACSVSPF